MLNADSKDTKILPENLNAVEDFKIWPFTSGETCLMEAYEIKSQARTREMIRIRARADWAACTFGIGGRRDV